LLTYLVSVTKMPSGLRSFFAGKADAYARYRVDYPQDVISAALSSVDFAAGDVVADLGSGTGMLTRWLLEGGSRVMACDPVGASSSCATTMRQYQRFHARLC
jgi:predicted RNA methylase